MIRHKFLKYMEVCNDMDKEEVGFCLCRVVECENGLGPLGKVVNNNDYVLVAIARGSPTFHEVNLKFVEGMSCDDGVNRRGWCSSLCGKDLETSTMLQCKDAITKESMPKKLVNGVVLKVLDR